jgi:hypothetical protein
MCHHDASKTACGTCFVYNGFMANSKEHDLVRIKRTKRTKKEATGKLDLFGDVKDNK